VPLSPVPFAPAVVARFPENRLSDAQLVEAVARGEKLALSAVWDRYAELVRGVLFASLGPDSAAEDLLQEVFLALFRGAKNIKQGSALRGYLIGVAVRLAALELRRRKVRRWVNLSPTGELPEMPVFPRDVEGMEALRALGRVFDRLNTRRRLAFVLREVEGLELSETAHALGVSESTAKREVARAREQVFLWASREPSLSAYLRRLERGALP
jgi:RNA polymerase sigma-70 factor (ECF subfamily)